MMRWVIFVGLAFLSISTAWAQNGGSEIVVPPAPPLVPETPTLQTPVPPAAPPPPGLVQAAPSTGGATASPPSGTVPAGSGAAPATVATQPPPPDVAPTPQGSWTPGQTAELGVLNKVDGSTAEINLPVGGAPQTSGDLSVSVQACLSRPSGQIPDSAVFLTVTPLQGGAPIYRGWMLRSAPGATFVGNAGQTFRIVGCS